MENTGLSASDIALLGNNGMEGNAFIWIFALLILANGGLGGWGRNGEFGQYATAASQSEILFGQQFQGLDNKIDRLGNGIADATFALNNSIKDGNYATQTAIKDCCCTSQRNTDALRYDMATQFAAANANTTAQTQKILDALAQNKIDTLQAQLNTVQMQQAIQNAMCGVPKVNPYMYSIGCNCNNGCSAI